MVKPPTARKVSAICDAGDSDGVTAHEQQDERVVGLRCATVSAAGASHCVGQGPPGDGVLTALASLLAAQQVGQPARGDGDQPTARVVRDAVLRPLRGGREERLLHRVLGGVEVPVAAHHRAEDLRRQPAQQVLDVVSPVARRRCSVIDLQIVDALEDRPHVDVTRSHLRAGAFASRAAISVARSKLSHSTIV